VGSSSAVEGSSGKSAKSRKKEPANGQADLVVVKEKEINASVKLAGYLNLMCVVSLSPRFSTNCSQRRLYPQYYRWACDVFFLLRFSYDRCNDHCCCLLPRNPTRGWRLCITDPVWILKARCYGGTIRYGSGGFTWYGHWYTRTRIRRKRWEWRRWKIRRADGHKSLLGRHAASFHSRHVLVCWYCRCHSGAFGDWQGQKIGVKEDGATIHCDGCRSRNHALVSLTGLHDEPLLTITQYFLVIEAIDIDLTG